MSWNLMRNISAAALIVVAGSLVFFGEVLCITGERGGMRVETVFYNGKIYTLDERSTVAEAIAVGGGKILDIGSTVDILSSSGPQGARFDLGGRTVIPGLIDAHAHFLGYAESRAWLDLVGTNSIDEILDMVAGRVRETGAGQWILGRGWDQNDWPEASYPNNRPLDAIAEGRPVYLVRVCGHAALASSEALRLAGISRETPDPPGGKIVRDDNGEPTGVLIDEAKELVSDMIPSPTKREKRRLLINAARSCLEVGLVGVHEMGVNDQTISLYKELFEEEALPFRITAYYSHDAENLDSLLSAGPLIGYADNHLSVVGVKLFSDGSLGARSAALLEDYSDDPGNRGLLVAEPAELYGKVLKCHRRGLQVAVHAIGDRANRLILDIYEKVLSEQISGDIRHRIEHAQILSPADVPRFNALGIIPSMQFTHCTSDMPWAESRLGPGRLSGAYAWRSLLSTGCRIPGGSDFPVESINPFLGIYAAVTRKDLKGCPDGGWLPHQCLTVEEAVRAFTIDAAFAVHEEKLKGTLERGKLADFVVLSDDVLDVPPEIIPEIEVIATVLGGQVVYEAEGFSAPGDK